MIELRVLSADDIACYWLIAYELNGEIKNIATDIDPVSFLTELRLKNNFKGSLINCWGISKEEYDSLQYKGMD